MLVKNYSYVCIFLTLNYAFINSFITIPFKYINKDTGESTPNTTSITSYFESFYSNLLYTTFLINDKSINFHITLDRYATYISENTIKEIDQNLIKINKNEEGDGEALYSLEYIGILRTSFAKTPFNFLLNNTKNITLNNFSYFIAKKMNEESDYIKRFNYLAEEKEEIGLNIYKGNKVKEVVVEEDDPFEDYYPDYDNQESDDDEYGNYPNQKSNETIHGEPYINKNNGYEIEQNSNLINQLISAKLISSYEFMIKYNKNEEKGEIIIGGLPHEYDPKHYSEKYFIYDYVNFNEKNPGWRIGFKEIKYGDNELNSIKSAELSLDFGFIISYNTYKEIFDKFFFKNEKYEEYCKEEKVGIYYVKYCNEKVIKEFKTLSFSFSNVLNDKNIDKKIEFNYKDLFLKAPGNNDIYYFQIVFDMGSFKWVFGRPLFKKYPTVLDQDKKIFGFYLETGEYDVSSTNQNQIHNKININFSWVLVIVLSICLIVFGIIFYFKFSNFKRKKKANELDDDFDYEPASDNNVKNEDNNLYNNSLNN